MSTPETCWGICLSRKYQQFHVCNVFEAENLCRTWLRFTLWAVSLTSMKPYQYAYVYMVKYVSMMLTVLLMCFDTSHQCELTQLLIFISISSFLWFQSLCNGKFLQLHCVCSSLPKHRVVVSSLSSMVFTSNMSHTDKYSQKSFWSSRYSCKQSNSKYVSGLVVKTDLMTGL